MRWPMRDARLWDGFCEKHAYERHAYLHRLEKRGEPSWPAGAWRAGLLSLVLPKSSRLLENPVLTIMGPLVSALTK
jgi:hypothetical protein